MIKEAYNLGLLLGMLKQAKLAPTDIARWLGSAPRIGRRAYLTRARLARRARKPGEKVPDVRTREQLEEAAHSIGRVASPDAVEATPVGRGLISAGAGAFDITDLMKQVGRERGSLHRMGGALKARMQGEPRQYLP
jgi:hypothetical protein